MKFFTKRLLIFLSPLILILIALEIFYYGMSGDLIRSGYFPKIDHNYKNRLKKSSPSKNFVKFNLSELDTNKLKVLVLGDSFAGQELSGFKNFLAEKYQDDVFFIQRKNSSDSPYDQLASLINIGFFESHDFSYVILESVERKAVKRAESGSDNFYYKDLNALLLESKMQTVSVKKTSKTIAFPPAEFVKFPLFNFLRYFDDKAFFSTVYSLSVDVDLFSVNRSKLLVLSEDIQNVSFNSNEVNLNKLNSEINSIAAKLKTSNTELIFLVCPDKYSFYYSDVSDKHKYQKPDFFNNFEQIENKNYITLNTLEFLKTKHLGEKDVYYYNDSHWGAKAAKSISDTLLSIINNPPHAHPQTNR